MAKNRLISTIETLFKGMDQFITTKTVVGGSVRVGETIIVPLTDVIRGMAAGAFTEGSKQRQKGDGSMSAKMSPSAVLVIQGGVTKLVSVKNQDTITKVVDMTPDFVNKFTDDKLVASEETMQVVKDTAVTYDTGKTECVDL